MSMWQLDADDAEPSFDDREGQDEYTEMQMPVWPHSSSVTTWAGLTFFSGRDVQMYCLSFFFFFFSIYQCLFHFVSPILFLHNSRRRYIYTYVKVLNICSMSLVSVAKSSSPVLLIFYLFIYQSWNVIVLCMCCGGLNEFLISSQLKMIQEAL